MKRLTILLLILAIVLLSCDNNVHRKNFRVTFDNCFGTITYEAVNEGEAVARPADPTGDSSVGKFKAWVTDKNKPDETEYNFSTIVTKDITLYAHYYGLKTVTLQKPNGEKWKDISVSYGSPLSIEEDEIDGSIIECWLLDNKEYDTTKPVTTDITLKAKCYKTVEKDSEQYRQILGLMKLSQLFIEASDIDETNETIDGLTKETLIKMCLAHLKLIDTKTANTMSYYYNKNGINYNLCESYMNYKEFENILYANIYKDNTYIKGYKSKEYSDGSTKVIVSTMNVIAIFAKGKYDEDKKTIISDDSSEDKVMMLLSSIIVDSDKNKDIYFPLSASPLSSPSE